MKSKSKRQLSNLKEELHPQEFVLDIYMISGENFAKERIF
jgi:hypothetical protein